MKIDRTNYELFFSDYLDDKLSSGQTAELFTFLSENPDLEHELYEVREVSLEPAQLTFPGKNSLLRKPVVEGISSLDHSCISCMEGDMLPEEAKTFISVIRESPEKKQLYNRYLRTKLSPDLSVRFPYKSLLKKPAMQRIVVRILYPALAATAVIILFMLVYRLSEQDMKKQKFSVKHEKNQSVPVQKFKNSDVSLSQNETNKQEILKKEHKVFYNKDKIIPAPDSVPEIKNVKPEKELVTENTNSDIKENPENPVLNQGEKILPRLLFIPVRNEQYVSSLMTNIHKQKQEIHRFPKKKFSPWLLADAAVKGFNFLTGKNVRFRKQYNDKGEVTMLALNSPGFEFSTNLK
jgi:hypothetical protein